MNVHIRPRKSLDSRLLTFPAIQHRSSGPGCPISASTRRFTADRLPNSLANQSRNSFSASAGREDGCTYLPAQVHRLQNPILARPPIPSALIGQTWLMARPARASPARLRRNATRAGRGRGRPRSAAIPGRRRGSFFFIILWAAAAAAAAPAGHSRPCLPSLCARPSRALVPGRPPLFQRNVIGDIS